MTLPIKLTLVVALAYVLGAQLGFQLALTPHSPTTLFWPPSGIALAALILRGRLAIPGIFLGAVAVNIMLLSPAPTAVAAIGAMVTALASTGSAIISHALICRYAPSAPVWTSAQDILRGTLSMAIGCVIAAVFGVGGIYYAGTLPADAVTTTMGMWWLGDFCGMVVFTPVAFACARRVKGKFWVRLRPELIAGPMVLNCSIVLIALFSFISLWNLEGRAINDLLDREAALTASRIERTLQQAGRDIDSIGALASSWDKEQREFEFMQFASSYFYEHREKTLKVQAVGWVPLVKNPGLWELEMQATRGAPIQLIEVDDAGNPRPVNKRDNYFPVQFIHSLYHPAEEAIGYDIGSEPLRRVSIESARDKGTLAIAAPVDLGWVDWEDKRGMEICRPVYTRVQPSDIAIDRRESFQGLVCGIYLLRDLLEQAPNGDAEDIIHHLADSSDNRTSSWHYAFNPLTDRKGRAVDWAESASLTQEYRGNASVRFAGQEWQVFTTPGETFVQSNRSWIPWSTLLLMVTLGVVVSSILIERANARRRVNDERRKTIEALHDARAANEAKSYFMAAASHDIKQPLYALGILTDTMLMTDPPEATIPIMKSLKKSIAEMSQHFDTLMDVGRFQDGSFEPRFTTFYLRDLEPRVALEIGPLCREKALDWHIDFDDIQAYSDPELLLRLLRNLLINAVRYTPQGKVSCTAKQHNEKIEFIISDTGSGLSSSQRDLVYREVVQLEGNAVHTSAHGLGLSIVNTIGKALNIEIDVSSNRGQGTSFTFSIPVAAHPLYP